MKKINLLLLTLFLFACSPVLKGIGKYEFEDRNGEKQEVSVVIEMKDDEISSISIDETYTQDGERTTKKRLGAAYGMKEVEGSKGEWNEQIKHLDKMARRYERRSQIWGKIANMFNSVDEIAVQDLGIRHKLITCVEKDPTLYLKYIRNTYTFKSSIKNMISLII